ncbi:MAG: hypothetical protein AB7O04_01665 [Hyphomonadaceae bacterium]
MPATLGLNNSGARGVELARERSVRTGRRANTITATEAADKAGVAQATIKAAVSCGDLHVNFSTGAVDYLDEDEFRSWAMSKRLIFA